jgi:sodium/bile acid cotransporter 7
MGQRLISLLKWDPFLLALMGVVGLASLFPVQGRAASWTSDLATLAIVLLFFVHGAKLSREAIIGGIGNWRLHLLVLGSTYVLFPALGLGMVSLFGGWLNPLLLAGLLFLALLPSTVQSSIAFTAVARGNVAAAVCSASLSNLIGIVLTPLLVALLITTSGKGGAGLTWDSLSSIALQLLAPFLVGHLLRPLIGEWLARNKALVQPIDRGSILIVVYSAFSAAVIKGIWQQVGPLDLLILLALSGVLLALVMGATVLAARLVKLPREDAIVLLFCGSKKSLVSGVPMAGALFAPAQVGMIVLPLMIFHQLQLIVCSVLASRLQASSSEENPHPTRG